MVCLLKMCPFVAWPLHLQLPEKSSEERSSLFAGGLAGTPPPTSAEGQPRRPSDDDQATALMLSPFAAAHPEDDIEAASGSLAAQRQAFLLAHSSQSSDAFLRGLMRGSGFGMAGRDVRAEGEPGMPWLATTVPCASPGHLKF